MTFVASGFVIILSLTVGCACTGVYINANILISVVSTDYYTLFVNTFTQLEREHIFIASGYVIIIPLAVVCTCTSIHKCYQKRQST